MAGTRVVTTSGEVVSGSRRGYVLTAEGAGQLSQSGLPAATPQPTHQAHSR